MKSLKSEAGLTLVEIIVGIGVLTLFLFSITLVINSTNRLNDRGLDLAIATGFAEKKIEALRSADFVGLPPDGTVVDFASELPLTLQRPTIATYTITDINVALKQIDVSIQYQVGPSTEVLDFTTYLGELGVGQ